MSSPVKDAFATPGILENVLEHVYGFATEGDVLSDLLNSSLVAHAWTRPSQALLHRRLVFKGSNALPLIQKWIAATAGGGENGLSKFLSFEVTLECLKPIEAASAELELVATLFRKARGVERIVLGLWNQQAIPFEWLRGANLSGVSQLVLGAPLSGSVGSLGFNRLEFLGIYEKCPKLSRNWCETLAVLARSNGRSLRTVEVVGLLDYPRYLVPTVPLAKDLQSIRGSLLPFADHLRVLSLPCLLPSKDLYNLAIFGVACRSLELLQFVELSSYSASSIPILRFFPTVQALAVKLIVGLPFAPHLRQGQLDRFTAQGRGDVVAALGDLFSLDSQLDTILFENGKYFYREHCEMFGRVLIEKGRGNLTFPTLIPLAPEEAVEATALEIELQTTIALERTERAIAQARDRAEQRLKELEEQATRFSDVNGDT